MARISFTKCLLFEPRLLLLVTRPMAVANTLSAHSDSCACASFIYFVYYLCITILEEVNQDGRKKGANQFRRVKGKISRFMCSSSTYYEWCCKSVRFEAVGQQNRLILRNYTIVSLTPIIVLVQ